LLGLLVVTLGTSPPRVLCLQDSLSAEKCDFNDTKHCHFSNFT